MANPFIEIAGRKIGVDYSPYVIAEISCNHGGSLESMLKHIEVAKQCGADAVKIQIYTKDDMTIKSDKQDFKIDKDKWGYDALYDLYGWSGTIPQWIGPIFSFAKQLNITVFASVFNPDYVSLLELHNCPSYKIASMELTYEALLKSVGATRKPIILSTGLATEDDIHSAVRIVRDAQYGEEYKQGFKPSICVMHCISDYPTYVDSSNLNRIDSIKKSLNCPDIIYGLSDHSLTELNATIAVAKGASIIERHFALYDAKGPDVAFSDGPDEFKKYVRRCKMAWYALGNGQIDQSNTPSQQYNRSIYVVKPVKKGEKLTTDNIKVIRPGYGLHPRHYDSLIKHGYATRDFETGNRLTSYGTDISS